MRRAGRGVIGRTGGLQLPYPGDAARRRWRVAMTKTEYLMIGLLFAAIAAGFYVALYL
jgi:hypothetical protein